LGGDPDRQRPFLEPFTGEISGVRSSNHGELHSIVERDCPGAQFQVCPSEVEPHLTAFFPLSLLSHAANLFDTLMRVIPYRLEKWPIRQHRTWKVRIGVLTIVSSHGDSTWSICTTNENFRIFERNSTHVHASWRLHTQVNRRKITQVSTSLLLATTSALPLCKGLVVVCGCWLARSSGASSIMTAYCSYSKAL
jgi:hypothetical protein